MGRLRSPGTPHGAWQQKEQWGVTQRSQACATDSAQVATGHAPAAAEAPESEGCGPGGPLEPCPPQGWMALPLALLGVWRRGPAYPGARGGHHFSLLKEQCILT